MSAKRLFQKTGKKITINRSNTAGYDKAKIECFNCHKMGNFAREIKVPRNHKNKTRNQETTRRIVNVENTSSKAMVAIDGAGFDWSYMANNEAPTNMAFMDFLDSKKTMVHHSLRIRKSPLEIERKTIESSVDKVEVEIPKQNDKSARRPVKYTEMYKTQRPRGYVAFGGGAKGGKITRKGKIRTDTECFVMSLEFKLVDESHVLLKVHRKNNMYNVDMKNIVPKKDLTCHVAKATNDESILWHRRI
nr:ribonuclease H-like domain-containing protein [Tanacetum cinerariifolium]